MSERSLGPLAIAALVLGVAGAVVIGVVAWTSAQDEGVLVVAPPGTASTTDPTPSQAASAPTSVPVSEPTAQPAQGEASAEPTSEPAAAVGPLGSFDINDEVLEAAIIEGAANPLVGLPSRDRVATALLNAQLAETGVDLTGMEFIVYPASSISSFVLLTTSDATPLLGLDGSSDSSDSSEDAASERFLTELIGSPVIADFDVEKLIMQHTGTDEVGPFVMTLTVSFEDLHAATEGVDVFDRIAVQMERP